MTRNFKFKLLRPALWCSVLFRSDPCYSVVFLQSVGPRQYSACDPVLRYFFESLDKALDVYCNYEKVVLVGDFNAKIGETCLDNFLLQHELESLNKEPTCLKIAKMLQVVQILY